MRTCIIGTCLLALVLVATPAQATSVDLELLLLVDVSGSVDANEYALQKTGYVNAFNDADVHARIAATTNGIAVAYAEWSGDAEQSVRVNWAHLTDAASAMAFASAISSATRMSPFNLTAPGSAINWGVPLFDNNGFEGGPLVIDISGDGSENDGDDTQEAAETAFSDGVRINGLPILTDDANLDTWYQTNIVTPGGGFLVVANSFDDFEAAIKRKIVTEIIPEPGTIALLGLGFAGLVVVRRRRK
jgi:hypothetical protein